MLPVVDVSNCHCDYPFASLTEPLLVFCAVLEVSDIPGPAGKYPVCFAVVGIALVLIRTCLKQLCISLQGRSIPFKASKRASPRQLSYRQLVCYTIEENLYPLHFCYIFLYIREVLRGFWGILSRKFPVNWHICSSGVLNAVSRGSTCLCSFCWKSCLPVGGSCIRRKSWWSQLPRHQAI